MVRRLLNSQRREVMERIMVEAVRSYLERSVRERGIEPPLNQADWQVTLDFYACGMAGLLLGSDRLPHPGSGAAGGPAGAAAVRRDGAPGMRAD